MSVEQPKPNAAVLARTAVRDWQNGLITFEDARRRIQALIYQAQKERDPEAQGNAHLTMSYLFSLHGRHEHALGWAKNAERLFKQLNDLSLISGIYITQGEIYRVLGDYTQASKLFEQAYDAAVQANEEANQLFAKGNSGHVALALRQYEKARDLLEAVLKTMQPYLGKDTWLASPDAVYCEYQSALVLAYMHLKDYDKAWENADSCSEKSQKLEQSIELAKVKQTLGELIAAAPVPPAYSRFGTDFRSYFEAALAIYKSIGADLDYAQACAVYGDALIANDDKADAKSQYQLSISIYSSLGMYPQARQVTQKVNNLNLD